MLGAILAVELVQSTDWDKEKHKNKLAHFQILPWNGVIGMYRKPGANLPIHSFTLVGNQRKIKTKINLNVPKVCLMTVLGDQE